MRTTLRITLRLRGWDMTQQQSTTPRRKSRGAILRIAAATVLVASLGGFSYWFFTCPCDRTPGGYLLGTEAEEPISDWSFANNVELCQIQITAGLLPHSINLNCMATFTGELYLSCSLCDGKRATASDGPVPRSTTAGPGFDSMAPSIRSPRPGSRTQTSSIAPGPRGYRNCSMSVRR